MTTLAVVVIMWIVAVGILLGRKVNEPHKKPTYPLAYTSQIIRSGDTTTSSKTALPAVLVTKPAMLP